MNDIYLAYLGYFAGFCTTIAFVPQVYKIWKTKSAKDISLVMFIIFLIGVFCWLIYGIFINAMPLIIANFVTLILAFIILIGKIKYS